MENALIDDRRIHVDFSQSVSKLWNQFRRKNVQGKGCFKCGSLDDNKQRGGNKNSDYEMVFDEEGGSPRQEKVHRDLESDRKSSKSERNRTVDGKHRDYGNGDPSHRERQRDKNDKTGYGGRNYRDVKNAHSRDEKDHGENKRSQSRGDRDRDEKYGDRTNNRDRRDIESAHSRDEKDHRENKRSRSKGDRDRDERYGDRAHNRDHRERRYDNDHRKRSSDIDPEDKREEPSKRNRGAETERDGYRSRREEGKSSKRWV